MKKVKAIKPSDQDDRYMVWFFPGGETRDDRFNMFTGSFIRLMKEILCDDFEFIKGVNYKSSFSNVIWALNNAQKPVLHPDKQRITKASFDQIIARGISPDTRLVILSSSSGSVIAAQTACYLTESNINNIFFTKPFHLVLGASMVNGNSELYRQLMRYRQEGKIDIIIHDEIQDKDDNSAGIGGLTRLDAYKNAFGIMFPFLSGRYKGPSFLNAHPEKGHIHRKRSKSIQKALDYIDIILIRYKLAGSNYMEKAVAVLMAENGK
jgi:hypothetical protein